MKEEQTAAYSVEIWKRFRKWGGIPTALTQNVKDLLASPEVSNIFENSDFVYMLNQTLPALQSLLFPEEPLDTSDVFHLFFSFLESLIQEDMLYLQNFEKRLATIEESLLDTLPKELQRTLITIRRELLVFHAYYQQLLDMCEILSEDENHFLPPECARQFSRLGNRVDRLYDHTQMLREYAL